MKTPPRESRRPVIGHFEPLHPPFSVVSEVSPPGPIGMIAGNGLFPHLFLDAAKQKGYKVVIVAHQGETNPSIANEGFPVEWIRVGQVAPIFKIFQRHHVRYAAFVGGIRKPKLFDLRPDWRGIKILARVAANHDDQVLRALAQEFEQEGITIVPSTFLLPELTAPKGVLGTHLPTQGDWEDINVGFHVGKVLGDLDVGQCVIVREKVVLALEAIEGTNETIRRGARFAPSGVVVVKMSKPNQDLRFDLPSVGSETLAVMGEVGARVLAVEAGKSLILDAGSFMEQADRLGIAVVGVEWE
ncbi:MAG: LpxI family protein [Leptospirales bacterium]